MPQSPVQTVWLPREGCRARRSLPCSVSKTIYRAGHRCAIDWPQYAAADVEAELDKPVAPGTCQCLLVVRNSGTCTIEQASINAQGASRAAWLRAVLEGTAPSSLHRPPITSSTRSSELPHCRYIAQLRAMLAVRMCVSPTPNRDLKCSALDGSCGPHSTTWMS